MRIRTIKPEFWKSEDTERLSEPAMLLAIGLLNYADDYGYFNANPKRIKGELFQMRDPSRPIADLLSELEGTGFIALCKGTDGRTYGHIVTFLEHQRICRPSPSKIAPLCRFNEPSASVHGTIVEPSAPEQVTGSMDPEQEAEVVTIAPTADKAGKAKAAKPSIGRMTREEYAAWFDNEVMPLKEPIRLAELHAEHPGVDILAEMRKARTWAIEAAPGERKKSPRQFIANWLNRATPSLNQHARGPASNLHPAGYERHAEFEL